MRVWAGIAALTFTAAAAPVWADTAPVASAFARDTTTSITGEVTRAESRWAGSAIVTDVAIQTVDGEEVEVLQLGGAVGDIGMRVSHTPPVLAPGQTVRAELRSARTLTGEARWTLAAAAPERASEDQQLNFVRTITSNRTQVVWESSCAYITYHPDGTSHLDGDREFQLMDTAFRRWVTDAESCSYFQFKLDDFARREVAFDGVNMVIFREDRWCRPPAGSEPEVCYSPSAAGITTLFFVNDPSSPHDGQILDADIELNAVDFAISSGGETRGESGCLADLANTLTHEVGHFLGLDHTCWDGNEPQPRDHEGEFAPDCSIRNLPDDITDATMYAFQECGETNKASLTPDDVAGKCGTYPRARDPGTCSRVQIGGCCSLAAAGPRAAEAVRGGAALAILGGLVLLALRRRRRLTIQ